ncbi:MAG: transketolase, partial [Planctomycetes bacterium]|nr:transketolase [Planctomycetota bacterium]
LRAIPNLHVFRPADGAETAAAWTHALSRRDGPVTMALTRQNLPKLPHAAGWNAREALRGGYVLVDALGAKATIVATGAEVGLAVDAASQLAQKGTPVRVVSMPCVELFLQQPESYRKQVLGSVAVFTLEMGRPEWWCQFTGRLDRCIGQTTFGASAPAKLVAEHFGFTAGKVAERVLKAL